MSCAQVHVFGCGVIGLLVVGALVHLGLVVVAIDPDASRRALALSLGAAAAHTPGAAPRRAADVTIESSGNPAALQGAIEGAMDCGRVVLASWYGKKPVALALGTRFHRSHLEIVASQVCVKRQPSTTFDRLRQAFDSLRPPSATFDHLRPPSTPPLPPRRSRPSRARTPRAGPRGGASRPRGPSSARSGPRRPCPCSRCRSGAPPRHTSCSTEGRRPSCSSAMLATKMRRACRPSAAASEHSTAWEHGARGSMGMEVEPPMEG